MYQDDPGLEQRLSRFEAQLDRFSLALLQWQAQDHAQPVATSDVDQRIRTLEETFDRETLALRQLHAEPLLELQAQAATLKDVCASATNSVNELDQAELRLVELHASVSQLVADLSRSVQMLVEQRGGTASTALTAPTPAPAWPLDRVVHLHDELRRTENGNGNTNGNNHDASLQETATGPRSRMFQAVPPEHEVPSHTDAEVRRRRWWYIGGAAAAVGAVVLAVGLVRWIETRLDDASARVASAEQQVVATTRLANQEVVAARDDANRQIAEARQLAQRAETVGVILTAPDLIRFNLTSGAPGGSSAQLLWSRTRGLVFSGSRLPPTTPESTYQLWLVTSTQQVSAGLFLPDSAGRAALVLDTPPKIPGAVIGASVTLEPKGGRLTPSGQTLLTRYP